MMLNVLVLAIILLGGLTLGWCVVWLAEYPRRSTW